MITYLEPVQVAMNINRLCMPVFLADTQISKLFFLFMFTKITLPVSEVAL